METKKKNNLKNLLIAGICIMFLFGMYSYVLVRSAVSFGYSKGYEKGAVDGINVGKAQAQLDFEKEMADLVDFSDSIATKQKIVSIPTKIDTVFINRY